ncbi:MAG: radical SAM protein [Desulfobulbales bacterium]|nr:radical SAM protein [Desulfobulbales bacterium]
MISFRNLEMHVTHSCNLACESCSHYCNHGHKGMLSPDEAAAWMDKWSRLLSPAMFSLLGGEPTLNPQLPELVRLCRDKWPESHLRIATNGFFLHRHQELPHVLRSDPNSHIEISIHHFSSGYLNKIKSNLHLLQEWHEKYGIKVVVTLAYRKWTRRYKGFGAGMEPFEDNQPRKSWENCPGRDCFQLFRGKIWKCAPLAYLILQDAKYRLSPKWKKYLQYEPLEPGHATEYIADFFRREAESYCSMCASNPEQFCPPLPYAKKKQGHMLNEID